MCFCVSLSAHKIYIFNFNFRDDPKAVEILEPPTGSSPGDKVTVENYSEGQPDDVLNPKKKVWEKLQVGYFFN